jgi:hypothetical protein
MKVLSVSMVFLLLTQAARGKLRRNDKASWSLAVGPKTGHNLACRHPFLFHMRGCTMRNKSLLAVGLVSSVLFLAWAAGAQTQSGVNIQDFPFGVGKPKEAVSLPEGLRHVPPDCMGFIYFRTGKFLESKMGHALRQDLLGNEETKDVVKKLETQLGMRIQDLESVTLVALDPIFEGPRPFRQPEMKMPFDPFEKKAPDKGPPFPKSAAEEKRGGPPSPVSFQPDGPFLGGPVAVQRRPLDPAVLFIVTANKPLDRKKMIQRLFIPQRDAGPKHGPQPILFLSERSFAIGEPGSLIRLADAGHIRSDLETAMALAKDNHVLVAGFRLPANVKKQIIGHMQGFGPRPEVTFFPLLNVAWAGLTVDLGNDGADLQVHLRGWSMRSAELAVESAKTGLTLLELGIDTLEKLDKKSAASAWLPTVKKALASAKIERQGARVNMDVHADLDAKVIKLAITEITEKVKQSGARQRSQNNLKQIALAMHSYHDAFRGFPPAALTDKGKKPLLSWRVAILPFIEQAQLYRQFKMDEPWDSEHNKKLIPLMPSIYADPRGKTKEAGLTYYQVFVGPGTVFEPFVRGGPGALTNIRIPNDIPDGTSNTIMAVEAGKPVIWTKPHDLPFDPKQALPPLGGLFPDGFNAALCDGSVRFIRRTVPAEILRLLIIRNDGNVIPDF